MLLRTSISKTKKFFQNTMQSLKSFLSSGYQKLPKTPPLTPLISCSDGVDVNFTQNYRELDKLYTEFTTQWDGNGDKALRRRKKKPLSPTSNHEREDCRGNIMAKQAKASPAANYEEQRSDYDRKKSIAAYERKPKNSLVAKKLKELEKLDKGNVEHALDIEEVLHYYSRLTCPAYVDIVDKFFMDMYAELFNMQASTHEGNNSRLTLRSLKW